MRFEVKKIKTRSEQTNQPSQPQWSPYSCLHQCALWGLFSLPHSSPFFSRPLSRFPQRSTVARGRTEDCRSCVYSQSFMRIGDYRKPLTEVMPGSLEHVRPSVALWSRSPPVCMTECVEFRVWVLRCDPAGHRKKSHSRGLRQARSGEAVSPSKAASRECSSRG